MGGCRATVCWRFCFLFSLLSGGGCTSPVWLVMGSSVTGTGRCHIPPVRASAGVSPLGGILGQSRGWMGVEVQLVLRVLFQVPGAF